MVWILLLLIGLVESLAMRRDGLTILHTNDIHSHYDEFNRYGTDCTVAQREGQQCYGGLARLKAAIDGVRLSHANVLLVDAGDQFQGTMFYTFYRGNATWEAMNLLQYDLMTLGNHEFDDGPENVARVAGHLNFPLVSCNINASEVPALARLIKPYHLFPKHRLAVVGYITSTAPAIASLGRVKVEDPVTAVQRTIDQVNKLGYRQVIAVSHNGYDEDKELATRVRGLALIVGGHSHSYLAPKNSSAKGLTSQGMYPTKVINGEGKGTYIVQAYCWGRFLGHIDIIFDEGGYIASIEGAPIELDATIQPDSKMQSKVKEMRNPFDEYANRVIGQTESYLDQTKCQLEECAMGSLITDALYDYRPEADFAFINAGGIRASIAKGNITIGTLLTVIPFNNAVVEFPLAGTRIWELLEAATSKVNQVNLPVTSFIQVAGIKFHYDEGRPIHSRLIKVELLNKTTNQFSELELNRTYTVVTFDFLASGGDNLLHPPILGLPDLELAEEVVLRYIKANSPIQLPSGDRIIRFNPTRDIPKPEHSNGAPIYSIHRFIISRVAIAVTLG